MKKITMTLLFMSLIMLIISCEFDNYNAPNAILYGSFKDKTTGDLVQQELLSGSQIEYIEHGYANVQSQFMICKVDGNYKNSSMFAGTYDLVLKNGNYVPLDTIKDVVIAAGSNKKDFEVQPYIRLKDVKIERIRDTLIVATFKVERTIVTTKVQTIGLFGHTDLQVAANLKLVQTLDYINVATDLATTYRLEINLKTSTALKNLAFRSKDFYFRVGALVDVPNAKFNYAPSVKITCYQ